MNSLIKSKIEQNIDVKQLLLRDEKLLRVVDAAILKMIEVIQSGGKIFLCGNGGSASDALHIAGELVGRFQHERKAWPAIALNADVAAMTAIANDYGYSEIYSRQVEAHMNERDLLIGISTSGNSENIYKALSKANELGGATVGLLGKSGGKIREIVDYAIVVPSDNTARIQECHILIGHIFCEIVEIELMKYN